MSALLLALAIQDGWTWKFELKLDGVKKVACVAEKIGRDYDRGRLTWQRAALHTWGEMDRPNALRLYTDTMKSLPPDVRKRVYEAQAWVVRKLVSSAARPRRPSAKP